MGDRLILAVALKEVGAAGILGFVYCSDTITVVMVY